MKNRYTRSERRAILSLSVIAIVISVVLLLFQRKETGIAGSAAADSTGTSRSYHANGDRQPGGQSPIPADGRRLFSFDPNTADSSVLLSLGLSRSIVSNVIKYRNHGGVFRRREDFARIYGLMASDYKRLSPFIRISPDYSTPASTLLGSAPTSSSSKSRSDSAVSHHVVSKSSNSHKIQPGEFIDLNVADTSQLKRVPGIGSYYARQIIRYGERLGGYVSTDQLDEIEDFPMESKVFFKIVKTAPSKLNVNKLSLSQLRRHPYINYYQARDIIDYRRTNGPLKSINDLSLSPNFTPSDLRRLSPYLDY